MPKIDTQTYIRPHHFNLFDKQIFNPILEGAWQSGIYALYDKKQCIYIGQTVNVWTRLNSYRWNNASNKYLRIILNHIQVFQVYFKAVPIADLNAFEAKYIDTLRPVLNMSRIQYLRR